MDEPPINAWWQLFLPVAGLILGIVHEGGHCMISTILGADANTLVAWGTLALAVIAAVSGGVAWWMGSRAKYASAATVMQEFQRQFDSEYMRNVRRSVASSIVAKADPKVGEANEILAVFELIAWSTRKRIVTVEHVWSWIGDTLMLYYLALEKHIETTATELTGTYAELLWLVKRLNTVSVQHGISDPNALFKKMHDDFFAKEANLPPGPDVLRILP
jgi:hypothetical protein